MGNCLVMEKKVIKIIKHDGKVLEYREPISVHHILSQFSGHSLFDKTPSHHHHLLPDPKLLSGRLYYLLPPTMNKKKIKKVKFANPEVEDDRLLREYDDTSEIINGNIDGDDKKNVNVVRMKIVVRKQEFKKLLQGGSVHDMMYQTLEKQRLNTDDYLDQRNRGWRPVLECIPEFG